MTFLLCCFVAPLLLGALCLGAGLLVDRVAGDVVPGPLLVAVGFALLVVVGQLLVSVSGLAPVTPWAFVVIALAGFVLGWTRLKALVPDRLVVLGAAFVYVVVLAPVLLTGSVALPGFLLDTTVGIHLAGAREIVAHGLDFSNIPSSSMKGSLSQFFGLSYPSGIHVVLGSLGKLTGQELIWLYQPLLAFLMTLCVPVLFFIARRAKLARRPAVGAATLASLPALTYAYVQMGAIKEIGVLPIVLCLGAAALLTRELLVRGPRAMIVLAVVCAAGIGAIGLSFGAWIIGAAALALAIALVDVRAARLTMRQLLISLSAVAGMLVVLALPTITSLASSLRLANSLAQSNAAAASDPGNLVRPLKAVQALGVWLGGSHRVEPDRYPSLTYVLIGVMLVGVALGVRWLVAQRAWAVAGYLGIALVLWFVLTKRGTEWTDAKVMVITSPVVVLLAFMGVQRLLERRSRLEAVALAAVMAAAILGSAAFTYHATNISPNARIDELTSIGARFSGGGPALLPDFDEYAFYTLGPGLAPDGPNFTPASKRVRIKYGGPAYGQWFDLDQFTLASLQRYSTIITRIGPEQSRPPSSFRLAYTGRYYQVWRRTPGPHPSRRVVPKGGTGTNISCPSIRRFAASESGGRLRYLSTPAIVPVDLRDARRSPAWVAIPPSGYAMPGPGGLTARVRLYAGGPYDIWLRGDFSRRTTVDLDGRPVGSIYRQTGAEGSYARAMRIRTTAGRHTITIRRGGGTLRPGDKGPARLVALLLQTRPQHAYAVRQLPASRWRELCGQRLDWVEAAPR